MQGKILLELVIWAITLHQQPLKGSILFANGAVRVLKTNRLKLNFKHTTQNVIGQIDMAKLFSPKRLFDLWKVRFFKNESCTVKSRFFPYNSMQCLSFSLISNHLVYVLFETYSENWLSWKCFIHWITGCEDQITIRRHLCNQTRTTKFWNIKRK